MAWEIGPYEFSGSVPAPTVLYVSPSGNDANTGTSSGSPLKTLAFTFGRIAAGGTIYLMTGTFTDINPQWHTLKGGTSFSAPTTITTFNGAVTIKPSANTPTSTAAHFYSPTCKYIIVNGLIFDGTNVLENTIEINNQTGTGSAHHIRFTSCTFQNAPSNGAYTVGTGGNEFTTCTVTGNGTGLFLDDIDNIVDGCTIHDNDTDGIGTFFANNSIIRNCTIYNHTAGAALRIEETSGCLAYNNVIHDNLEGITLSTATTAGIYNNTIVSNTNWGIKATSSTATVRNNITYLNGGTQPVEDGGGSTITAGTNLIGTNPHFVSSSDYHLTSSSTTAIDGGVPLGLFTTDHDGNGRTDGLYDLGAYEFQGAFVDSPVTGPTLASSAVVRVPTVRYPVSMPTIASGSVVNKPTVVGLTLQTLAPPSRASTVTVRAPSVAYRLAPPTYTNTPVVNAPTMGYVVRPPALTSSATLATPTVKYLVTTPTIASGSTFAAPTVYVDIPGTQLVFPATLTNTAVLRAPTVVPGALTALPPTITTGSVVNAPARVDMNVGGPTLTNAAAFFFPAVALSPASSLITPELINTNSLFNATVTTTSSVTLPFLDADTVLYPPGLETLIGATIASGSAVYAPSTIAAIEPPTIASSSTVGIPMIAGGQGSAGQPPAYITVFMWKRVQ